MANETRHILLVNCDRAIEEMMLLCLETIPNCETIVARSNVEAIVKASSQKIAAILLYVDDRSSDLGLSKIIRAIEQNPSTNCIPLILLTSTPQAQNIVELQRTKEIETIALSFDLSNLASQISTLLDWN